MQGYYKGEKDEINIQNGIGIVGNLAIVSSISSNECRRCSLLYL